MTLESRVPPPLVALAVSVAMAFVPKAAVLGEAPVARIAVAVAATLAGIVFCALGVWSFRKAATTVSPLKPASATSLVVSGVYRVTRNPMYLGMALMLVGWGAYLWSPWAWLGPFAFAVFIDRFQIRPEERAMRALFGGEFDAYRAKVRRWL